MGLKNTAKETLRSLRLTNKLKDARFAMIKSSFRRKDFDPREAVVIFSDPRGGSTWLMEMLEQIPRSTTIFEPLHAELGLMEEELDLGWRPYIPADYQWQY